MYEYKFVKVDISSWTGNPKENHQEIIAEHAKDGWRLVQIFAPAVKGTGFATYFEIIFERPSN